MVGTLVDVSKTQLCRRNLTLITATIPIGGNYSVPFPEPPNSYTPPSIYALSLLYCPKAPPIDLADDDIGWEHHLSLSHENVYGFHPQIFLIDIASIFKRIYYLLNTLFTMHYDAY